MFKMTTFCKQQYPPNSYRWWFVCRLFVRWSMRNSILKKILLTAFLLITFTYISFKRWKKQYFSSSFIFHLSFNSNFILCTRICESDLCVFYIEFANGRLSSIQSRHTRISSSFPLVCVILVYGLWCLPYTYTAFTLHGRLCPLCSGFFFLCTMTIEMKQKGNLSGSGFTCYILRQFRTFN